MTDPWNLTEPQRRQFREAQAARAPARRWRVYGPRGLSIDYRSERAAYERVNGLTRNLGTAAKVYHWQDGSWTFYELIEAER